MYAGLLFLAWKVAVILRAVVRQAAAGIFCHSRPWSCSRPVLFSIVLVIILQQHCVSAAPCDPSTLADRLCPDFGPGLGQSCVRPVPTPCRGSGGHRRLAMAECNTLVPRPSLAFHCEDLTIGPTLLELSMQDSLFRPYADARALVEVLQEAWQEGALRKRSCAVSLNLSASLPVTDFQQTCLDLLDTLPSPASEVALDWLDNDIDMLLHDRCVPLTMRSLFVNVCKWHDQANLPPTCIEVFSDGSASRELADGRPCSWALTVWAVCSGQRLLIGHAHGVAGPEGTPFYLGESVQSALTGELLALCWSLAWTVEFAPRFRVPVCHFYDAISAGAGTFAECSVPQNERSPYSQLFALATSLRQIAAGRVAVSHAHVSGHSGSLGNELADQLAKLARRQTDDPWNRCLPSWLPALAAHPYHPWAWTHVTPWDVPTLYSLEAEAFRMQQQVRLPWKAPTTGVQNHREPEGEVTFSLCFLSFHVLTLLDKVRPPTASGPPGPLETQAAGMRVVGRKELLRRLLADHAPHIIGLQETRLPEDAAQPDADYLIFSAQADDKGHGGCSLWLSKSRPYAKRGSQPLFFESKHVTVVSRSARHLTASLIAPNLRLFVVVAHAPSAYNVEVAIVARFWEARKAELDQRPAGMDYVVLTDANARLGGVVSDHVGDLDPEEESAASEVFHAFLAGIDAIAPSTLPSCHAGESGTWRAPHGEWHRIDYILLPVSWQEFGLLSSVVCEFEIMQLRDDHRPVKLQCSFARKAPPRCYQTSARRAVRPPVPDTLESKQRAIEVMTSVPRYGWQVDVDVHCESLAADFCKAGRALEAPHLAKPQRPYIAEDALTVISYRKALQSYLKAERKERDRRWILIAFAAFRLCVQSGVFDDHARSVADSWMSSIDYSEALALALFRWYGLRLRELVAAGKRAFLRELVNDASQCSLQRSGDLYARVRKAFPAARNARRSSYTPLPMLLGPDGEPLLSTEARDQCWRAHFSEQEAGFSASEDEYVSFFRSQRPVAPPVFSLDVLPTLAQTEQVFLHLKNGKAAGSDGLTAELLKLSVRESARRYLPVMMKSVMALREPVSWRGGDLILLAKRAGKALSCDGFRSILIASVAGKAFHRCIRAQLLPLLRSSQPELMAGAVEGIGIEVPALAIRSFQLRQQGRRSPWAVLFFDLQSAYYRVLRQLVVRHDGTDEALLALLRKLELPPEAMQELYHKLGTLAALPELKAGDHLQSVVADLLSGTWFRLDARALITVTTRGTRPGDPLADCLFALTLSSYLRAASLQLDREGLHPQLEEPECRPAWAEPEHGLSLGAPSWADDFALPQTGKDAPDLLRRVVDSVRVLVSHARFLGMVIKFGEEKTAALISSMVVRSEHSCIQSDAEYAHFLWVRDDIDGTFHKLPVVEVYKHLGGVATSNCSPAPDLNHRFARACGVVKPLSRRLFSSQAFELSVRRTLLRSLALSKYVHTGAALVLGSAIHQRLWDRHYIALWRHLVRRHSASVQAHPFRVLHAAKATAPPLALAQSRASFLRKLFSQGPKTLLTLLYDHWIAHRSSSWLRQLQDDIAYAKQYLPELGDLLAPGHEVEGLLASMDESPAWWPQKLKAVEKMFKQDLDKWLSQPVVSATQPVEGPSAFSARSAAQRLP